MCWEDVELGAHTHAVMRDIQMVINTDTVILPANPHRRYVTLGSPVSGSVWYATNVMTTTGQGFGLAAGIQVIEFNFEQHGDIVTKAWHAFSNAAVRIAFVEGLVDSAYMERIRRVHAGSSAVGNPRSV